MLHVHYFTFVVGYITYISVSFQSFGAPRILRYRWQQSYMYERITRDIPRVRHGAGCLHAKCTCSIYQKSNALVCIFTTAKIGAHKTITITADYTSVWKRIVFHITTLVYWYVYFIGLTPEYLC